MRFPFVSRERFDEERTRAQKAEEALESMRQKFLDYLQREPAPLALDENTDLSTIQPIGGRPTIANVIGIANRDAFKASQTGGPSPAKVLQEARDKLLHIKKEVNGG
jgi:hypothetical protein